MLSCLLTLQLCWAVSTLLSHSVVSNPRDPTGCGPPGSSVHGDSEQGKDTGVGCRASSRGIFPTQGSNSGLLRCWQILSHLNHQGSPRRVGWGSLSLLQQVSLTQESNQGLPHCRWILYKLSYQGSPCGSYILRTYFPLALCEMHPVPGVYPYDTLPLTVLPFTDQ